MTRTPVSYVLTTTADWKNPLLLALACGLFIGMAAPAAHAQFTYTDLFEMNCNLTNGPCIPFNVGQLWLWTDGNLYGTASEGGTPFCALIFNVSTSGSYTDVLNFTGSGNIPGCGEWAGLTPVGNPITFYGATSSSGSAFPTGELFHFDPSTNGFKVLHTFPKADDNVDLPQPVVGKDGNLYGATRGGLTYTINSKTDAFKLLPNKVPGVATGPLFLASDGNLYGTANNYSSAHGLVFSMTTAGVINTVYTFTDTSYPNGPLTQGADGYLYGTAQDTGNGSVFKVSTSGSFQTVYTFGSIGPNDGKFPYAGLLLASDGNFYGTTEMGGASNEGTIFEIAANGGYHKLFDFTGNTGSVPGFAPSTTLMQHPNGSLYGLTEQGGVNDSGVFYSLTPFNVTVSLCCNRFVILDQPVNILGVNLDQVVSVTFAGVAAQFQQVSPNYLMAFVPSGAADGPVVVTAINSAGGEEQIQSQQTLQILPTITNLDPGRGSVGTQVSIVGGGFAAATEVTFGGVPAGSFTVVTPSLIQAIVPTGATTGKVVVTTPNGLATSKKKFIVR